MAHPVTERDAFGQRIATDARYFLETLTSVKDLHGAGLVPFRFNVPQVDYYNRIWLGRGRRDIVGKSRKWGFSTQRLGLGLHGAAYTIGRIFRIVAHRAETAAELNRTVKLLYESAKRSLTAIGLDWEGYLPRLKYDTRREYYFPDIDSAVIVDTALGRGVGQSDRSDDLYITEYSEWKDAAEKRAALVGSLPAGLGRVTIDFNAKGIGNDAYAQYQAAKRTGQPDWNGYEAVFYGILDCPDVYQEAELAQARRELGRRFVAVYPSNDEEMWLKDDKAVFDWDDVRAMATDGAGEPTRYLVDLFPSQEHIRALEIFHGVDAATGGGKSYQVCRTRALWEGELWDVEPSVRAQIPEHEFAERVHARWAKWGGLMTVEANMAQATLLRLKQLGIPPGGRVFKRKDPLNPGRSRWGFATTLTSKRTMIDDYRACLADRSIKSPDGNLIHEARIFEWKDGSSLAGAPEGVDMNDDEIMADLVLLQGMKRERPKARVGYRRD